jgi:hypothetical protein
MLQTFVGSDWRLIDPASQGVTTSDQGKHFVLRTLVTGMSAGSSRCSLPPNIHETNPTAPVH